MSHPTNRSRLAAHPTVVELRIRPPERSADIGLPLLRGRLHQAAFVLAVPAGLALVLTVNGISARIAALVYSVTLAGLFASSALYNRRLGTPLLRPWMKWADHAMSYLLIAGSYTPMCVVSLPRRRGIPLLAVIWTAALAGAGLKFVWRYRFRVAGGVLAVRGSIFLRRSSSKVVIEIITVTNLSLAKSESKSISRRIRLFLVMMETGWR